MQTFYNSKLFRQLSAESKEIDRLKWIESEKVNRDIGRVKAIMLWTNNHKQAWLDNQKKGSN